MRFGLEEDVIQQIKTEIQKHLGSSSKTQIYIYGSRVKGNFRKFSDIDLLLTAESYDDDELDKIDFEKLDIPYKVDFVLERDLFEGYKKEILSHIVEL